MRGLEAIEQPIVRLGGSSAEREAKKAQGVPEGKNDSLDCM